ncbi:peptidoglycan DD-metalloendopeptidase family protein [Streptomyces sp. NPDC048243]|uniref:murein hydrolase activator EnvC family protein n=1 Tax=Streptomyces sp. NPDC048243 TaxID=3365522 RepID=UPI00371F5DBA
MRPNRCVRTRPGLLLCVTLTVLGALTPAAPASTPVRAPATGPLSVALTSSALPRGGGPAPPFQATRPVAVGTPTPGGEGAAGSGDGPRADPGRLPEAEPADPSDADAGLPTGGAGTPAPNGSATPPVADPAVPAIARSWPVGVRPPVVRGWEPPATAYSRGHRGVDLEALPAAQVRAVAPGRVSFAGRVAGRGVVSVELSGTGSPPLRTTYGPVRASVRQGDEVLAGTVLGTVEATRDTHCGPASCLHWGLLRGEVYLNPLSLMPPWLLGLGPSRLLPLDGPPPER